MYDRVFERPGLTVQGIRKLERLLKLTPEDLQKDEHSDYLSDRINEKINGIITEINVDNRPLTDCEYSGENLIDTPIKPDGNIINYIGCIEGYDFQKDAADQIYLFYDENIKKAVICFEYT